MLLILCSKYPIIRTSVPNRKCGERPPRYGAARNGPPAWAPSGHRGVVGPGFGGADLSTGGILRYNIVITRTRIGANAGAPQRGSAAMAQQGRGAPGDGAAGEHGDATGARGPGRWRGAMGAITQSFRRRRPRCRPSGTIGPKVVTLGRTTLRFRRFRRFRLDRWGYSRYNNVITRKERP